MIRCTGLDDVLQPYVPRFVSAGVTGQRLLSLDPSDLERLGVEKLGHRDLILEAVHLLSSLVSDPLVACCRTDNVENTMNDSTE